MNLARIAPGAAVNPEIVAQSRCAGESNIAWLSRALTELGPGLHVVLIGGNGLVDFRLRVAQSQLRGDMMPSHWSHALALVTSGEGGEDHVGWHVDLSGRTRFDCVPATNGIQAVDLGEFVDPVQFPNVGVLQFPARAGATAVNSETVAAIVGDLQKARLAEDLVTPLVRWLGFVWGAEDAGNPLLQKVPMPSARLTELIFAAMGIDINPSTAGHFTCPETIWNAARWWSEYYGGGARGGGDGQGASPPRGRFTHEPFITLRDRSGGA